MIVAPPKSGKTQLLSKIACSIRASDPDALVITTTNSWATGYCADGVVTNNSDEEWVWEVRSSNIEGEINNIWGAEFTLDGEDHVFVGASWNDTIDPGGTADFGFCANL